MPVDLGGKIGPLSKGMWVLVLGGGLLAGLYLRKKFANAAASTATSAAATPGSLGAPVDTSGGSVGASQAPASSGLDPAMEQALIDSQNSFLGLTGQAFNFASGETANWSDFAKFITGTAFDFVGTHYPSPAPVTVPPLAPAPAPTPVAPAPVAPVAVAPTAAAPPSLLPATSPASSTNTLTQLQTSGGGIGPGGWIPHMPVIDHVSPVGVGLGALKPVLQP